MKSAGYIAWETMQKIVSDLSQSRSMTKRRIALMIHIGSNAALRVSDLRLLKWKDLISGETVKESFTIHEQKTGKVRTITINKNIGPHILDMYDGNLDDYVFRNRNGQPMTARFVNYELKRISEKYRLPIETFSSHSFRKTFARRVISQRPKDPLALSIVQDILNHSNIGITRRYLGIRSEEIASVYENL